MVQSLATPTVDGLQSKEDKVIFDNHIIGVVSKTTTYLAVLADEVVLCDATSAGFTVDLPTAVGNTGKSYIVKKIDSSGNAVTIDGNAAQTIDGAATKVLSSQYASARIVSDGANWHII